MGALITALGRSELDSRLPNVAPSLRAQLANGLGSGGSPAGGHGLPASVVAGVREAFVSALGSGLLIGAAVTLCGAVAAWLLIEPKLRTTDAQVPGPSAAADESVAAEPAIH
jgi:hypothetical protein